MNKGEIRQTDVLRRARELESPGRAVIATDPGGRVVYWGPGATQLYGWVEAEAMGRPIVELTPSRLSRLEAEEILKSLQRGEPWSGEFEVQGKDGDRFTAHVTDMPVVGPATELIGIIGISRRVDRRQAAG